MTTEKPRPLHDLMSASMTLASIGFDDALAARLPHGGMRCGDTYLDVLEVGSARGRPHEELREVPELDKRDGGRGGRPQPLTRAPAGPRRDGVGQRMLGAAGAPAAVLDAVGSSPTEANWPEDLRLARSELMRKDVLLRREGARRVL